MAYKFAIENQTDCLRVDVSGVCLPGQEVNDAICVWRTVAETCVKENVTHILAVWDVSGRLPTIPAFSIVAEPETFGWKRSFKLAVVQLNEERFKDSLFSETVANNRGYNIKIFQDEPGAKSWLLHS